MSVKREYSCNFCHDTYGGFGSNRTIKDLVGIHWTGIGTGSKMEIRQPSETENHICVRCIREISKINKMYINLEEY